MPAAYTHYRFGRDVLALLPEELRGVITAHSTILASTGRTSSFSTVPSAITPSFAWGMPSTSSPARRCSAG